MDINYTSDFKFYKIILIENAENRFPCKLYSADIELSAMID